MATLHLICGLPCAGKTTLAKELEQAHNVLRLTPDEWHMRIFGEDFTEAYEHPEHDRRHTLIESLMWEIAARVLTFGTDVILDFGFWAKSERDDFRNRATKIGARVTLHYVAASQETLLERLAQRNAQRPHGTFTISQARLLEWIELFEAPAKDELESYQLP